jgi:hypothetical protein
MSDSCFVSHLECSATGERHEAGRLHNLSRAGKPLLVRYDLAATRAALPRERLSERAPTLWRYRELLPYRDPRSVIELGETMTPVIDLPSREFESPLRLAISSSCARCARAMDGRWRSPMRRSMRPGRRPVATTDCCCVPEGAATLAAVSVAREQRWSRPVRRWCCSIAPAVTSIRCRVRLARSTGTRPSTTQACEVLRGWRRRRRRVPRRP